MRRSCTFDFAITEREFRERGQALLQRVAGVDFLGFAEDEGLEQLGAGALRHPKIQNLIQQFIHENKVEAQLWGGDGYFENARCQSERGR